MRVLVVDDENIARDATVFTLQDAGFEVLATTNGQEALDMLSDQQCRLVVSDWNMPGMTGLDLCRAVRGGDFGGYVYFILLTSNDSVHDTVEGLSAGADDFITKPFNPAELIMRVKTGARIVSLETREMTIFALAKLAESRDPETGAHLERIRNYCRVLAQHLEAQDDFTGQIDEEFVQLIYQTSPLHDIGKVGIPDSVLLKPGQLTDSEFEIMKTHTTIGAEALEAALREYPDARFLEMARDIALTHHERWDGSGYPHGHSERDIPLAGRLLAVADVYDALTTKRVYKPAFTHEVARNIIVEGKGTHFDPELVEAFLELETEFEQISKSLDAQQAGTPAEPALVN